MSSKGSFPERKSINFIGDGLRDAFDPRQRRRITKKDRERASEIKKERESL